MIDVYPLQDALAVIDDESLGNGGGPYNLLKDLSKMEVDKNTTEAKCKYNLKTLSPALSKLSLSTNNYIVVHHTSRPTNYSIIK